MMLSASESPWPPTGVKHPPLDEQNVRESMVEGFRARNLLYSIHRETHWFWGSVSCASKPLAKGALLPTSATSIPS